MSVRLIEMRCPRLRMLNLNGCDISEFNPVLKLLQSCKRPLDLHLSTHTYQSSSYPEFKYDIEESKNLD